MGWVITIGTGAEQIVIDANARFGINVSKNVNSQGDVESVDWQIDVDGEVIDGDPDVIADLIAEYADAVAENHDAVEVLLTLDGDDKFDLDPADGFVGPFISNFKTTTTPGAGQSHWGFSFTILYKSRGAVGGTQPQDVYEFHTSLATTKRHGKIVRKVWKASATSTSSSSAKAAVLGFKPSDTFITEELEEFFKDARATAVWVWEAEAAGVRVWDCRVTQQGGGQGYVADSQAGVGEPALLHMKQFGVWRIDVRGRIVGFTPDIKPPAAHYAESDTLVRAVDLEQQSTVKLSDRLRQEYELEYHEVYLCTAAAPPAPKHEGDHHLADPGKAPANGGIAN